MIVSTVSIKLESFEVPSLASEVNPQRAVPAAAPCVSSSQQEPLQPGQWIKPHVGNRHFQLSEIPAETLLKMCDDFKAEVFKRAGKSEFLDSKIVKADVDNRLEMFKRNICKGFSLLPRDITIEQYANGLTIYIDCAYDLYEGLEKRCQDVMPDGLNLQKLIIQRPD